MEAVYINQIDMLDKALSKSILESTTESRARKEEIQKREFLNLQNSS